MNADVIFDAKQSIQRIEKDKYGMYANLLRTSTLKNHAHVAHGTSVRENCLPVIASTWTQADTPPSLSLPIQP
jgi:hypothetical protein